MCSILYKVGCGQWVWSVTSGEGVGEGHEPTVGKKLRTRSEEASETYRSQDTLFFTPQG